MLCLPLIYASVRVWSILINLGQLKAIESQAIVMLYLE